jgi:hypothetical protein
VWGSKRNRRILRAERERERERERSRHLRKMYRQSRFCDTTLSSMRTRDFFIKGIKERWQKDVLLSAQ